MPASCRLPCGRTGVAGPSEASGRPYAWLLVLAPSNLAQLKYDKEMERNDAGQKYPRTEWQCVWVRLRERLTWPWCPVPAAAVKMVV